MKIYEFNYCKNFSCINSECKHNCCIGWDIFIDKKSLSFYKELIGKDDRFSSDCFNKNSFKLNVNGRCPFLDQDNLCHIIKKYGEDKLCNICKVHPRFKNFFSSMTEIGLGLYCEHAGKIILSNKEKMQPVLIKDDKKQKELLQIEKEILKFRKSIISLLQDRTISIKKRFFKLEQLNSINLDKNSFSEWISIFCGLEKLDINDYSFSDIKFTSSFLPMLDGFEKEYENLLCYLTYRHIPQSIDKLDLKTRLAFVILSFKMINHIFYESKCYNLSSLIEACRFYCSEIETNDNNILSLLDEIEKLISFI